MARGWAARRARAKLPVKDKQALVDLLRAAIRAARDFLAARGIDLQAIRAAAEFNLVRLLDDAVDALLVNDETKRQYFLLAASVDRLFSAILPDRAPTSSGRAQSHRGHRRDDARRQRSGRYFRRDGRCR